MRTPIVSPTDSEVEYIKTQEESMNRDTSFSQSNRPVLELVTVAKPTRHNQLSLGDLGQAGDLGTEGVEPEWRVSLLTPDFVIWVQPVDVVRR